MPFLNYEYDVDPEFYNTDALLGSQYTSKWFRRINKKLILIDHFTALNKINMNRVVIDSETDIMPHQTCPTHTRTLKCIANNKHIRILDMTIRRMTPNVEIKELYPELSTLSSLEHLRYSYFEPLSSQYHRVSNLKFLKTLPQLISFGIFGVDNVTADNFRLLRKMKNIKTLYFCINLDDSKLNNIKTLDKLCHITIFTQNNKNFDTKMIKNKLAKITGTFIITDGCEGLNETYTYYRNKVIHDRMFLLPTKNQNKIVCRKIHGDVMNYVINKYL
jgi:hypothetical protein